MDQEILQLWKSGLSKYKVAEIYRRRYNEHIKQERYMKVKLMSV